MTVTGPGGVGKTRLALAAVARDGDDDSFAFVDLSVILDPALVAPAVADAIDLSGGGGHDPHGSLVAALADRPILLVVDNCEHLLDAVSDLSSTCSPDARPSGCSRPHANRSGIVGESVLRLDPLTGPDAAALFVERATDSGARLALERDWPVIDDICARVDCLPLAIELAAKHADHLPLADLLRPPRGPPRAPRRRVPSGRVPAANAGGHAEVELRAARRRRAAPPAPPLGAHRPVHNGDGGDRRRPERRDHHRPTSRRAPSQVTPDVRSPHPSVPTARDRARPSPSRGSSSTTSPTRPTSGCTTG